MPGAGASIVRRVADLRVAQADFFPWRLKFSAATPASASWQSHCTPGGIETRVNAHPPAPRGGGLHPLASRRIVVAGRIAWTVVSIVVVQGLVCGAALFPVAGVWAVVLNRTSGSPWACVLSVSLLAVPS